MRILKAADDVTPEVLKDAEDTAEWFDDRIDWQEFIDRLANTYGLHSEPPYDIEEYDNAAIRKIQRHVREYRNG